MTGDPATAPPSQRRYAGASAGERRAGRHERLIRAAIAVYGALGYRQATVSAVCRQAGLTPRYFYEAFENSQALLAAAFDEVSDYVIAHVARLSDTPGTAPEERLRALLRAYYELLRADPASARVFLLEMSGIAPEIDARFARTLDRFAGLIAGTLAPGRDGATGLRRTGAIHGLFHVARAWVAGGYEDPVDTVIEAALPLCRLLVADARSVESGKADGG